MGSKRRKNNRNNYVPLSFQPSPTGRILQSNNVHLAPSFPREVSTLPYTAPKATSWIQHDFGDSCTTSNELKNCRAKSNYKRRRKNEENDIGSTDHTTTAFRMHARVLSRSPAARYVPLELVRHGRNSTRTDGGSPSIVIENAHTSSSHLTSVTETRPKVVVAPSHDYTLLGDEEKMDWHDQVQVLAPETPEKEMGLTSRQRQLMDNKLYFRRI